MAESSGGCTFSLEQRDWVAEDEYNGTVLEWNMICDRLDLNNGVWHCPHEPISTNQESTSERCVFHTPLDAIPQAIDTNKRFQKAIANATEDHRRSAQFLGATFGELRLDKIEPGCPIILSGATVTESLTISTTLPRKLHAERATFQGPVSFNGATDEVIFENTVWQTRGDFAGAEFGSEVQFAGATFVDGATFRRASIEDKANFSGAEFGELADFFDCHFGSDAVFDQRVRFTGDALFQDAHFGATATFEDAIFEGKANFSAPSIDPTPGFCGVASFKNADFDAEADFDSRKFETDADFAEAEFSDDAIFTEVSFHGPARFLYAEFIAEGEDAGASFQEVEFEDRVDFEGVDVQVDARFAEASFNDVTLFRDATFHGELDFAKPDPEEIDRWDSVPQRVSFSGRTIFSGSTFSAGANLSDVEFNSRVEFRNTTFNADVTFDRAEFYAESVFVEAEFLAPASFIGSRFDRAVRFREDGQFAVLFDYPPDFFQAELSGVDLREAPMQNAEFRGANLTEANLAEAKFTGARLEGALLNRANCFATNFQGAALNGAVMGDARIDSRTDFGFANTTNDSTDGYCAYDSRYSPSENVIEPPDTSLQAAISTYQLIEQLGADNGLDQLQSRAFIRRQEMRSREKAVTAEQADDTKTWLRAHLGRQLQVGSRVFMLYGERPKRVVGWWLAFIIVSSIMNLIVGVKPPDGGRFTASQLIESPSLASDLLYYTALGFAGIGIDTLQPAGFWGRFIAVATVFTGAVLISLFVFALGRQTAR